VSHTSTTESIYQSIDGVVPVFDWSYTLPALILADTWQTNFWAEADYLTSDVPGTPAATSHTRWRGISYFDNDFDTTTNLGYPCSLTGFRDNVKWSFGSMQSRAWTSTLGPTPNEEHHANQRKGSGRCSWGGCSPDRLRQAQR
jgi:hypothetical protein